MAHQLEIRNGEASMMYVGEKPWHGLGTELEEPATAAEAIRAAKLDWRVIKVPLFVHRGDGALRSRGSEHGDVRRSPEQQVLFEESRRSVRVRNRYGIVREDLVGTDECEVLGIVGRGYTPLQNSEAFGFFDPIVGEGAAVFHTAGVLDKSRRVWMLAKLPDSIRVVGGDVTDKYLLLSNSHDGSSAVQVKFTPVRVVCMNTLTMALSQGFTVRVTHTKNAKARLARAKRALGVIDRCFAQIGDAFREIVKVQMDNERLSAYLHAVFPDPTDPEDEKRFRRAERNRMWSEYFFDQGKGNREAGVRGTLWAAYNGIAEMIDHGYGAQSQEKHLDSVWFGNGYHMKARAFTEAVALAERWLN